MESADNKDTVNVVFSAGKRRDPVPESPIEERDNDEHLQPDIR